MCSGACVRAYTTSVLITSLRKIQTQVMSRGTFTQVGDWGGGTHCSSTERCSVFSFKPNQTNYDGRKVGEIRLSWGRKAELSLYITNQPLAVCISQDKQAGPKITEPATTEFCHPQV